MKQRWLMLLLGFGFLACVWNAGTLTAQEKGKVIEFDGLKAAVPAEWKAAARPKSTFRICEFALPKVKNDPLDAEMFIMKGTGGSIKDNIERWKGDFNPPPGKTIDEVVKVTEIKLGNKPATRFEAYGTYKYKFPPRDPNAKVQLRPNHKIIRVQYEGDDDVYSIAYVGPAATFDHYLKGFEDWLKALKK